MAVTEYRTFWVGALVCIAASAGCGDETIAPEDITREDVVSAFSAVTLESTEDGTTTDHLALGASLDITLSDDGTTSGRLFVPEGDEDRTDLDADLTGTFSFDDGTDQLTFDQEADTFLKDATFTAVRSEGAVQLGFEGPNLRVVLR